MRNVEMNIKQLDDCVTPPLAFVYKTGSFITIYLLGLKKALHHSNSILQKHALSYYQKVLYSYMMWWFGWILQEGEVVDLNGGV